MELQADLHNFGKKVEVIERASGTWFQKPRSVYWEWLFFGKDSPLKSIFSGTGENGDQPLSKYLFNLEVESVQEWFGYSKKVDHVPLDAPTREHFYGFGVLLAYAYIFGIRDLHRFNLVMTSTHLQVVDAEVVLANLVLPHETILLPFKDVPFESCGLSWLVPSIQRLTPDDFFSLAAGYVDIFSHVETNLSRIKAEIHENIKCPHPIRVILRNTAEYRQIITERTTRLDLLNQERVQLLRGDIPYFFKKVGDQSLYFISSSDNSTQNVPKLGKFQRDVDRHVSQSDVLLDSALNLERRMAQGLFFINKDLNGNRSFKSRIVSVDSNRIEVNHSSRVYLASSHSAF